MDVTKMGNPLINLDASKCKKKIVLEILPKLPHEFSFEWINLKEIMELSNPQFDP